MDDTLTAEQVIDLLHLEPLPVEGGYFFQFYRSSESVHPVGLPDGFSPSKAFATAIYYLRTSHPDSFSAIHRLQVDEIHTYSLGDPVEMLLLDPDGHGQILTLGPDLPRGHKVQVVVPRGVWQGGRVVAGGRWALTLAICAPGFDETDYEGADPASLIKRYPEFSGWITSLTRPGALRRMA